MVVTPKEETKHMLTKNIVLLMLTLFGAYAYGIFLVMMFTIGLIALFSILVFLDLFSYFGLLWDFSMSFSSSNAEDVSNALIFMNFVAIAVGLAGKFASKFTTKKRYELTEKVFLLAKLLAAFGLISVFSFGLHATLNQGISDGIIVALPIAFLYAVLSVAAVIVFVFSEILYAMRDQILDGKVKVSTPPNSSAR